jgi:hypothetical protein
VVFQFCCILHGISFTAVMAQLYQNSIGYDMQKSEKASPYFIAAPSDDGNNLSETT